MLLLRDQARPNSVDQYRVPALSTTTIVEPFVAMQPVSTLPLVQVGRPSSTATMFPSGLIGRRVQGMFEPVPIDLSSDSDRVFLDLFGTGIRNRSSLSQVSGKVGGVDSQVFYAGPQNEVAGLDQVNILLPRSLAGRGDVDVVLTIDGQATNPVTIRVR